MIIYNEDYFYNKLLLSSKEIVSRILSDKMNSYNFFEIQKANGTRQISAIKKESLLYKLQKNLYKFFLNDIPLPTCTIGFIQGNSYLDFLSKHTYENANTYYMRIDICDFFGSITSDMIIESLEYEVKPLSIRKIIADICTLDGILPQGAITSPALSNVVFRRLDQRILFYCQKLNVNYTRYADDLLFSSHQIQFDKRTYYGLQGVPRLNSPFLRAIKSILYSKGFRINYSKLRFSFGSLNLNGYIIKGHVTLSRKKLYELTCVLFYFNKNRGQPKKKFRLDNILFKSPDWIPKLNDYLQTNKSTQNFGSKTTLQDYLVGYRSFLISGFRYADEKKKSQYSTKINHIEEIISKLVELD